MPAGAHGHSVDSERSDLGEKGIKLRRCLIVVNRIGITRRKGISVLLNYSTAS